jgi:hypothetical protein
MAQPTLGKGEGGGVNIIVIPGGGGGAITWYALRMAGVQDLCLLVKWSSISCLRLEVNWHSPHFIVFTNSCTVRQCSRIASGRHKYRL